MVTPTCAFQISIQGTSAGSSPTPLETKVVSFPVYIVAKTDFYTGSKKDYPGATYPTYYGKPPVLIPGPSGTPF